MLHAGIDDVTPGETIVVWFSCGAASAVAAKRTIEKYGSVCKIRIVNNPVIEEHPDNVRFLKDVEVWLGLPIEFAINKKYPACSAVEVWDHERYMSGVAGAPCTRSLKKHARQQWEAENHHDWLVLGFTVDEKKRSYNFIRGERTNLLQVLIEDGLTKQDCFDIVTTAGLRLPEAYQLGMPSANCLGCVKSASPEYWNLIRKIAPDVFASRAEQSRRIGAKLIVRKGERIFLDELLETDRGRPLKGMTIECGIFCEEDPS